MAHSSPMLFQQQLILSCLTVLLYMTRYGTRGQTSCAPLMQSLVQQAEVSNEYGSWDACCARTGTDCFLTRQVVQPGFEPCDAAHGARAGCNREPEGTICMIGGDNLISRSPCGASQIRSCTNVIVRSGAVTNIASIDSLGASPASILAGGVLGSQLCCSASSCQFATSCTLQYNMTCVSDGTNVICSPFDQAGNLTYTAVLSQDCVSGTTTASSLTSGASTTPSTASTSTASKKSGKGEIVGGAVGGAIGLVGITFLIAFLCLRNRHPAIPRSSNIQTDENSWLAQHPMNVAPHNHSYPDSPAPRNLFTTPAINPNHDQTHGDPKVYLTAELPLSNQHPSIPNHATQETSAMAARIATLEARIASLHRGPSVEGGSVENASTNPSRLEADIAPPPAYDENM